MSHTTQASRYRVVDRGGLGGSLASAFDSLIATRCGLVPNFLGAKH